MPHLPPHINPFTDMGQREPMTTIALEVSLLVFWLNRYFSKHLIFQIFWGQLEIDLAPLEIKVWNMKPHNYQRNLLWCILYFSYFGEIGEQMKTASL
jgi:hypothetical protein